MKTLKLTSPYSRDIYFYYNCSLEQINKYLHKKYKTKIDNSFCYGFTVMVASVNSSEHFIVWVAKLPKRKMLGTIVHECLHLTYAVLSNAGVKLSGKTEEAYAYQLDDFVNQICRALKI